MSITLQKDEEIQLAPKPKAGKLVATRLGVNEIKDYHTTHIGSHFFDDDQMSFFRTHIEHGYIVDKTQVVFFVTRETSPTGNVGYTVRKFDCKNHKLGVETVTPFHELSRNEAFNQMQDMVNAACSA